MSSRRLHYLQKNYVPILVLAEKRSGDLWYLPELKITVNECDLFEDLHLLSAEALVRLRKRKEEAEKRLEELNNLTDAEKPHPNAKATKAPHLWLIKND